MDNKTTAKILMLGIGALMILVGVKSITMGLNTPTDSKDARNIFNYISVIVGGFFFWAGGFMIYVGIIS